MTGWAEAAPSETPGREIFEAYESEDYDEPADRWPEIDTEGSR